MAALSHLIDCANSDFCSGCVLYVDPSRVAVHDDGVELADDSTVYCVLVRCVFKLLLFLFPSILRPISQVLTKSKSCPGFRPHPPRRENQSTMPHHITRPILAPPNPNLPPPRPNLLFQSLGRVRSLRHLPRRSQLHRLHGRLGQSQQ